MTAKRGFTTTLLHSDRLSKPEHGALHKPIHTSVTFGYDNVQDLVDVFQNKTKGYAYSRQGNPTVTALEHKVTQMEKGILYVVDNTMTTPYLFNPVDVKATHVINSLTKYIGGHGDALGGSVTDTGRYSFENYPNIYDVYKKGDPKSWGIAQIRKKGLRDAGGTLAPEAAHTISVGAETLALRMERQSNNAQILADFFEAHPLIKKVFYPGVKSHPQYALATELFDKYGSLMSIELDESVDCFAFLNKLQLVVKSSNLGDTRTLAIPVAQTIFNELGPERRKEMGISDFMIRFSIGIEDIEDLLADFKAALEK